MGKDHRFDRITNLTRDDPQFIDAAIREIPAVGFIDRDELRMKLHRQYVTRLYGKAMFSRRLHDLGYTVFRRKKHGREVYHQAVRREPDAAVFGPDDNGVRRWLEPLNGRPTPPVEELDNGPADQPEPAEPQPQPAPNDVVAQFRSEIAQEPPSPLSEEGAHALGLKQEQDS